jgi:hypothetical protein
MITNFTDVKILTRNTTAYPISINDVKAYSKYFRKTTQSDTHQDAFITKIIERTVDNWEAETRFLLLDQTFKTSLWSQKAIYLNFKGRLTRLNVREFGDVLYHPCHWDQVTPKEILDTDFYHFTPESGTTPAIFQLKEGACDLLLYPVLNNLEITVIGGYPLNNFTDMPKEIKEALAMQCSDIVDADNDICDCMGFYTHEVKRIYRKYTAFTTTISF